MYKVIYTKRAAKAFRRFTKKSAAIMVVAIDSLAENPRRHGVLKLSDFGKAEYRLRVGEYRVMFFVDDDKQLVLIADIKRRTTQTYR